MYVQFGNIASLRRHSQIIPSPNSISIFFLCASWVLKSNCGILSISRYQRIFLSASRGTRSPLAISNTANKRRWWQIYRTRFMCNSVQEHLFKIQEWSHGLNGSTTTSNMSYTARTFLSTLGGWALRLISVDGNLFVVRNWTIANPENGDGGGEFRSIGFAIRTRRSDQKRTWATGTLCIGLKSLLCLMYACLIQSNWIDHQILSDIYFCMCG